MRARIDVRKVTASPLGYDYQYHLASMLLTKLEEVDLEHLNQQGRLNGINVCYSTKLPERETKGLENLAESVKGKVGALLLFSRDTEDLLETKGGHTIQLVPLWEWLPEG